MTSSKPVDLESYSTPQSSAAMQQEFKGKGLSPEQIQAELKAYAAALTSPSEGFHIVFFKWFGGPASRIPTKNLERVTFQVQGIVDRV